MVRSRPKMRLKIENKRHVRRISILALLGSLFLSDALAGQFEVKARVGQYRDMSEIQKVFPQFEIRVVTSEDFVDKQSLDSDGNVRFDVEPSNVKKLEWTTSG